MKRNRVTMRSFDDDEEKNLETKRKRATAYRVYRV